MNIRKNLCLILCTHIGKSIHSQCNSFSVSGLYMTCIKTIAENEKIILQEVRNLLICCFTI